MGAQGGPGLQAHTAGNRTIAANRAVSVNNEVVQKDNKFCFINAELCVQKSAGNFEQQSV